MSASNHLLQRKCTCGGSAALAGECTECQDKKLLGKPHKTKLRINEPGDEYEQEADRVAEQVMRMADSAKRADTPDAAANQLVQRRATTSTAGLGAAPPIVHEVLSSPGQPLDATARVFFEPRFGHDFANVRVHTGAKAAESARAIHARAYTVGCDIVLGAGENGARTEIARSLLAHELTHVLQQGGLTASWSHRHAGESRTSGASEAVSSKGLSSPIQEHRLTPTSRVHGYVQRSGLEQLSTTEGQLLPAPTQPPASLGLPQPDCSTRVNDVFWLGPTVFWSARPECRLAAIFERPDLKRWKMYRADYSLEGKQDCGAGNQKNADYWLHLGKDQWRIVEIDSTTRVTVMNNCGEEEILGTQEGGVAKPSEPSPAPLPQPSPAPSPEKTVDNPPGRLGRGKVNYETECNKVTFTPEDNSKPSRVFIWDPSKNEYVDEKDKTKTYTPGELERIVGITTKVYEGDKWQGGRCGDQPPWAL